jgi:hypothetical protein
MDLQCSLFGPALTNEEKSLMNTAPASSRVWSGQSDKVPIRLLVPGAKTSKGH